MGSAGKRAAALKAEEDFNTLLKESTNITSSSQWSSAKRSISSDRRYDAVGSSSLREELFNNYVRGLSSTSNPAKSNSEEQSINDKEEAAARRLAERKADQSAQSSESKEDAAARKLAERKAKSEASLREREAKVREERERVEREMHKSKVGAGREEAETLFTSLLVDSVRDPNVSFFFFGGVFFRHL